jgi:hypothetical protein
MNKQEERIQELISSLRATGGENFVLDEEAIVKDHQKGHQERSGLVIKALSVLGGFLATLLFIGFLFIAGLYESEGAQLLFGLVFIGAAIWTNKKYDNIVLDTFGISVFVIGFFMVGVALGLMEANEKTISLVFMIMTLGSLALVQNYMLSFISVLIFNGSILVLLNSFAPDLIYLFLAALITILTYVFLNEAKLITRSKKLSRLYLPARTALIFSFAALLVCLNEGWLLKINWHYNWLSFVIIFATLAILYTRLFRLFGIEKISGRGLLTLAPLLLLLPTLHTPAIAGAVFVLLLSFMVNYKTGLGLGILSLVYFLIRYYYDLHFTLLTKSGILFLTGLLFILGYVVIYRRSLHDEN